MSNRQVSASTTVPAPPEKIFALLADPSKHPLFDGSGTVVAARGSNPERLTLGSKFGMDMKMGPSYRILNTVVEFEENRLIAWRHFFGHRWRWQLEPLDNGDTTVTETFDWSTARLPVLLELVRFPGKNLQAIRQTLPRLAALFA